MALLNPGIGPGLLGGQRPVLPRVPWGQNPMVTAAGLGLLSGRNIHEGFQNVGNMMPSAIAAKSGMQQFMLAQQERDREKAEAEARRNQMNEVIKNWPGMSPEQRAMAMVFPSAFGEYAFGTMTPSEQWESLTTPAARLSAGIPNTDTRPAQRNTKTGEIKFPGGTGTTINVGGEAMTPGRKKADETFAADYVEWTSGGFTDAQRQIQQLEGVVNKLKSGTKDNLTGPVVGNMPDWMSTIINPEAVDTREAVEEVVQRNLRLILGAQFTEKEGERLIARAYNPRLSEQENATRVERLLQQIKRAAQAKQSAAEYFAKHGTLTGWQGKLPSMGDFDAAIDGRSVPIEPVPSPTTGGGPVSWEEYFK